MGNDEKRICYSTVTYDYFFLPVRLRGSRENNPQRRDAMGDENKVNRNKKKTVRGYKRRQRCYKIQSCCIQLGLVQTSGLRTNRLRTNRLSQIACAPITCASLAVASHSLTEKLNNGVQNTVLYLNKRDTRTLVNSIIF